MTTHGQGRIINRPANSSKDDKVAARAMRRSSSIEDRLTRIAEEKLARHLEKDDQAYLWDAVWSARFAKSEAALSTQTPEQEDK